MMDEQMVYAHLIFSDFGIHFEDCDEPIPNWPLKYPENLHNLHSPVSDGTRKYFSNLTTGQFLCIVHTSKLFETYGITVKSVDTSSTKWHEIVTFWISHFTGNVSKSKAIWALYIRRFKRFKELQKCYNTRKDERIKESMITFLNSPIGLPKSRKSLGIVQDDTCENLQTEPPAWPAKESGTSYEKIRKANLAKLLRKNKQLMKVQAKQSNILTSQSVLVNGLSKENKKLKKSLAEKNKTLMSVGNDAVEEINKLKKKSADLSLRRKQLKTLKIKSTFQEKTIGTLRNEIAHLTTFATEALDVVEEKENKETKIEDKFNSVKKLLRSTKKKVQRRNKNISGLQGKLNIARSKYETDKESVDLYYKGIVENLKSKHQLTIESQQQQLEDMRILETQSDGKYKGEVRLLYYDLLTKGVSANTVQSVVRTVLENMTEYDMSKVQLPSRSTAQRMVAEAGELVKIRTAYEMSREKSTLCHQSDGTTKNLIHYGAHAVKLLPNDDPSNPKFFTLTVSPVSSGKADDTVKQLQEQFDELEDLANTLGLDNDKHVFSVSRIETRMSDRAANEKRVSKLILDKKEELNMDCREKPILYSFTCAAHKINNMASAMTDGSAKYLYCTEKSSRGMYGAKKHIYECNKLLCEHARKEYGLGVDFKAYTLCNEQISGSDLFRPIVGNRYLIFLQNAIPTLSGRDIVLMFLEDIKDAKENPGLNRLEFSVQQGYLNNTIVTEEIAFALMYYYVCSPLMQKAKSVKSPLEMNIFYELTVAKLDKWTNDPTGLVNGDDLLWEGATGPKVYMPYMEEIHKKMANKDMLIDILKVMAKAGKDKLHDHAVEHLQGGQYADPTPSMLNAACTVGEATNDRIESMFGMLDRQMMIAPSSNPVNVNSLISAKQDKPVQWLKSSNLSVQKICNIAMIKAGQKRKREGTRTEQMKKRFLEHKLERDEKIAKRRKIRLERKQRLDKTIEEAKFKLCRNVKSAKTMNKTQMLNQNKLWRAVSEVQSVKSIDTLKNFSKLSNEEMYSCLKYIIKKNAKLSICEWDSSDEELLSNVKVTNKELFEKCDDSFDWSSSDEETLDMACALVHL